MVFGLLGKVLSGVDWDKVAGDSATFYTVVACIAAVFVYLGASLIGFAAVLIKLGILFRSIADCDRTQYCSPANLSLKFMYAWTLRDCLACIQFLFNMVSSDETS